MRLLRILAIAAAPLFAASSLPAQAPIPAFPEAFAAQRRPLRLEGGHLSGPGAEALLEAARGAPAS